MLKNSIVESNAFGCAFINCKSLKPTGFFLILLMVLFLNNAQAQLEGPVSPPPGGAVIIQSGMPSDGSIGRDGGKTYSYSNVIHANRSPKVYWGVQTQGVKLSLNGADFSDLGEIMTFDPVLSDLSNGIVVWSGQTTIIVQEGLVEPVGEQTVFTRYIVTVTEQGTLVPVALTLATDEGLDIDVGGIIEIVNSATAIDVNMLTSATLTDGLDYIPHLDFFDPLTDQTQDGMAHVSVNFGFYYENVAPFLTTNVNNAVNEGMIETTITLDNLAADDYESDDSDITFVVGPDNGGGPIGGPPQYGDLLLDGVPLMTGDSFTQQDVVDLKLSYTHNGNDTEIVDAFQFSVYDLEGAIATDGFFDVFKHSFNITLLNDAPFAVNGVGIATIDGVYYGTFSATDADTDPSGFAFSIENVDVGAALMVDAVAGTFIYTAPDGYIGDATITFQVTDGEFSSLSAGTFVVTVPENTPPVATDGSDIGRYATVYNGTFEAIDLESLDLTFSVVSSDVGITTIIDANAGTFEIVFPLDFIGDITINFQVNDGEFDADISGSYVVTIPDGSVDVGDLLIANQDKLILHNLPANTDYILSEGDNFSSSNPNKGDEGDTGINALAYGGNDRIYVLDQLNGLILVDPLTGDQTILATGDNFTNGSPGNMAIEDVENLLISDLSIGLLRVNTNTGLVSVLTPVDDTFNVPISVDVAANNGLIYVGNAGVFGGGATTIMEVDPVTGAYAIIPSSGIVQIPIAINFNDDIELLVADLGGLLPDGTNQIAKVQIPDGTESNLSSSMHFDNGVSDLTISPDGTIYVATGDGGVLVEVDPESGATSIVPTDQIVTKPTDVVAVYDSDLIFENDFEE